MRIRHRIPLLFSIVCMTSPVVGCGSSGPSGPSFEVSFDSGMPRSARDQAVRVEVYLVDSCSDVALGARPVPAVASAYVVRDGDANALGDTEPGDYGFYGVAQDEDCAVVAAGCAPVTITGEEEDTLSVTLGSAQSEGCLADQVCSMETGNCVDGSGGAGGFGGMGGVGGSGGNPLTRVDAGLILRYDFDEGVGSTVLDQSDATPKHHLTIANPVNVTWGTGYLAIDSATTLSTAGAATKVSSRIATSGELTVEVWTRPSNITQTGPSRIISMSVDPYLRNFMLGQEADTYAVRFRASGQSDWDNGSPTIFTSAGATTTLLTHVVLTHGADGTEVIYIDGAENTTSTRTGSTTSWDNSYPLIVANEATNNRAWLGELHLIAIYDRALDAVEVQQNFTAGP